MFSAFKNRRPWAAALLSFFLGPFIGMLYLNRGRLAFLYLLIGFCLAGIGVAYLPSLVASPNEPLIGWLLDFPLGVIGAIHSFLIARHRDGTGRLKWYSHWYAIVGFVLIFPLAAFGIRTFLYQPFSAVSVSMSPSLNAGDYFFASKFAYNDVSPRRGDLIVFRVRSLQNVSYIKRVIGLPGDRVQMRNDKLFINGAVVPQRRLEDFPLPCGAALCRIPQYEETLPGGHTDRILDAVVNGPFDNTPLFVVPANSYFVLGDNRDNSDDSRVDVGFVSHDDIIGRPAFKYIVGGHWTWQPIN